jgi:hypothetical protein
MSFHAQQGQGVEAKQKVMNDADRYYRSIDSDLHEQIAQLLTYHALQRLAEKWSNTENEQMADYYIDLFERLSQRQPRQYQIDAVKDQPKERLIEGLKLIKENWLAGKVEPWQTVMSW